VSVEVGRKGGRKEGRKKGTNMWHCTHHCGIWACVYLVTVCSVKIIVLSNRHLTIADGEVYLF
jgi:hypothetical protein